MKANLLGLNTKGVIAVAVLWTLILGAALIPDDVLMVLFVIVAVVGFTIAAYMIGSDWGEL